MKIWLPKFNVYSKRLSMWQEKFWNDVAYTYMGIRDNVAGRKAFEYATFGRSGIQQSNSKLFTVHQAVSSFPYGNFSAAGAGDAAALTTQIDRAQRIYGNTPGTTGASVYAYGFAGDGNNYLSLTAFGVMDDVTYTDGGATSRTIRSVYDTEPGDTGGGVLYFSIDGASIGNTDTIWLDFTWDNTAGTPITVDRSADMTYTASLNGDTHWRETTPSSDWTDVDANTDFVLTTS